jgi:superkiller protein 3
MLVTEEGVNTRNLLDPGSPWAYQGLGGAYYKLHRLEEAMPAFQKAIELNPNLFWDHHHLGNIYGEFGRSEEAIAEWQKVIALDSTSPGPYKNSGWIYTHKGFQNRFERNIPC